MTKCRPCKQRCEEPRIHLSEVSNSVMNVAMTELLSQDGEQYVMVMLDRSGERLLIKPIETPKGGSGSSVVVLTVLQVLERKGSPNTNALALKATLLNQKLLRNGAGSYVGTWDGGEEMVVVDLRQVPGYWEDGPVETVGTGVGQGAGVGVVDGVADHGTVQAE